MLTEQDKTKLADIVVSFVKERFTPRELPVLVGFLTQKQGFKGFELADEGHPVFEFQDKYIIFINSLDGKFTVQVPYYKDTLRPSIEFMAQNNAWGGREA